MPQSLSALAPLRIRHHHLLEKPDVLTSTATTLFVDLVGFTPLTDRLGSFGSRGTEQLSEVLQGFFGAVTEQALSNGGDPVAYGGDALTIVFDGDGPPTLAAAQRLAESIHHMTAETNRIETLAGTVSLQTRIGIGRGPVITTMIRTESRSLPLQLGAGLDRAAEAETRAEVGQIVLHESATAVEANTWTPAVGESSTMDGALASTDSDAFEALVHPAVLQHLLVDSSLWQIHRTATVAFLGFPPVTPDDLTDFVATGAQLIQRVTECGGEVVQISGGDKGVVALVVFGAPVGHDDDPLRALQALLEFRRLVPTVRVGVTTGPIFTTWLGTDGRRLQAHFGGALNMAARLMQASTPHEILVDAATWHDAGNYLRQRGEVRLITVKGHDEPLEVHGVAGWRQQRQRSATPADLAVVGRDSESRLIEQLLDGTQVGRGEALTFEGPPGIGKSRLAREAVARARVRGMRVLAVDAEDFPYGQLAGLWREIIGARLDVAPTARRPKWQAALQRRLPDRASRLDLLGPLLDLGTTRGDDRAPLEPGLAVELSQGLVAQLVVDAPEAEPTLIVIENVHHFRPLSRSVLSHLQHRVAGSAVGLLTTQRTASSAGGADEPGGRVAQVSELSQSEATVLIEDAWRQAGGGRPPPWLASTVFQRAGGNPLFLLSETARVKGDWRPGDPPPMDGGGGDDSLARALTERIDLLDAEQRQVLAVLAVARRPLPTDTSVKILADRFDGDAVKAAVQRLQDGNFVRRLGAPSAGRREEEPCRLRHDLIRAVVYGQMAHADRVRLHRSLCQLLIAQDASAGEIAGHVLALEDAVLARTWYPRAGAEARQGWDVRAASEWWRLALPLTEGRARSEAEIELLELLLVSGRAADVLAAPTGSSTSDELRIRRHLALAEAAWAVGDFTRCEAECTSVMQLADGRDEGRYQRAGELLVRSMCDRGSLTAAVATAREQLTRALERDSQYSRTTAHYSLGVALLLSGDPAAASDCYHAALASAEATDDTLHQIHALSDLAGCAYAMDDYPRCLELLEQARVLAESIGYRHHLMFSLINEAQLRAGLGDPDAASRAHLAIQRALELGDLASAAETVHTWLTSEPALLDDPAPWQRLAAVNDRLGRTMHVADCYAAVAVAAARQADAATVRTASVKVRAHPEVTPGSPLDRRVSLATTLLAASELPMTGSDERERLALDLETLGTDPDVSAPERAELTMAAWTIAPDKTRRGRALEAAQAAFEAEPSALVRSWFDALGEPTPADRHRLPPPIGIIGDRPGRAALDEALAELEDALDRRSAD